MRRQSDVKNNAFALHTIQHCYLRFSRRSCKYMIEDSVHQWIASLFWKLTVRWQMNWANLCSWNNYLLSSIYPFFFFLFCLIFFLFWTFILLLFFYPRLFLVRTCVPFAQAATPLHALLRYPHRTSNATGKHSHCLLIGWSLIRFFFIVAPCKVYHLKV